MIIAEVKPIEELLEMIEGNQKVLVLGCGGCVSVCVTGGEKQAEILASQLALKTGSDTISFSSITRQCEKEFIDEIRQQAQEVDLILAMGCGAGVQLMATEMPEVTTKPAMNTTFMGANTAPGIWSENCRGCGDCVLDETSGICPMTLCSKNLANGPCGGTNKGMCEVSNDIDCAWYLIYQRLKGQGKLKKLALASDVIDWSRTSSGETRKLINKELLCDAGNNEDQGK